jgi:hypothetical protein
MTQSELRTRMLDLIQEAIHEKLTITAVYEVMCSTKQMVEVIYDVQAVRFLKEEDEG